jgi:hypothetical protein
MYHAVFFMPYQGRFQYLAVQPIAWGRQGIIALPVPGMHLLRKTRPWCTLFPERRLSLAIAGHKPCVPVNSPTLDLLPHTDDICVFPVKNANGGR